jgi:phage-related protein
MEIAVRFRSDAWRVVYVTEIAGRLWVLHAFQKKSKTGIKTPKAEIDLVRARLGRLKRELA